MGQSTIEERNDETLPTTENPSLLVLGVSSQMEGVSRREEGVDGMGSLIELGEIVHKISHVVDFLMLDGGNRLV